MQVVSVILNVKSLLTAANILFSSYFLKYFLVVMGHIAEGKEEVLTLPNVDRFHGRKQTCLGFKADQNSFQGGEINSHAKAGRYIDSLRIVRLNRSLRLVQNNINFNVLQLDPVDVLVWTAWSSFFKQICGVLY